MNRWAYGALLATLVAGLPAAWAGDVCAGSSDRAQVDCLAAAIDAEQKTLDALFGAALAALPADDPSDRRKARGQLAEAEQAWRGFIEANCAYVGAAEGGSNLWVTNLAARCELDEIRRRAEFFRSRRQD